MKPLFEMPAMLALDGQEVTTVETILNSSKTSICVQNGCSTGCSTGTVKPGQVSTE